MKRDGQKLDRSTLEKLRVQAVQRMLEGEPPAMVASSLGLHRSWAYKCRTAASVRGLNALRSTISSGRPRRLSDAQECLIFLCLNGQRPDQYGLAGCLWTRPLVQQLVLARFDVKLSLAAIGVLLARLRLTALKPLECAHQRDAQGLARWKRKILPGIVAEAKCSQADVLFWDECDWQTEAPQGQTVAAGGLPPVRERQRTGAVSATSAKGAFWHATYPGSMTGERLVELLQRMMCGRSKPVRLVMDGAAPYAENVVRDYIASMGGRLALHILPGAVAVPNRRGEAGSPAPRGSEKRGQEAVASF